MSAVLALASCSGVVMPMLPSTSITLAVMPGMAFMASVLVRPELFAVVPSAVACSGSAAGAVAGAASSVAFVPLIISASRLRSASAFLRAASSISGGTKVVAGVFRAAGAGAAAPFTRR